MRILFVCENYHPHYGGAEVLFKNLAEGSVKEGHAATVLTHWLKGTARSDVIGGVTVRRILSFSSRYLFTFFSIPAAIRLARKHDLIQTTTFNGAFPAWLAAKLAGKPVVLTVHEAWQGKWREITGFPRWKSALHEFLEGLIYRLPFDQYICVSQATKDDLLRQEIAPEKVEVIYNGLDYEFWNPKKVKAAVVKDIKKRHNLYHKFAYFSWGRPGPSKGFEYLIKAVPLIAQQIPDSVLLLMLGSREKYPQKYRELRWLIQELTLSHQIKQEQIQLLDSQPYEELRNYVQAADCIVVPSLAEGFGYTAVEALAMNKPLVVSDAGSLPEIVGGKYQVFRSKDVRDLAEKVVKIARKEFLHQPRKKFEWKESIWQYLGIYQKLLDQKNHHQNTRP